MLFANKFLCCIVAVYSYVHAYRKFFTGFFFFLPFLISAKCLNSVNKLGQYDFYVLKIKKKILITNWSDQFLRNCSKVCANVDRTRSGFYK